MRAIGALRGIALAACVILLAAPALADIKSFNAAVQANDYKRATAEAAATWPTLNKARKDIAIVAREFGFAAYQGGDYAAAKTYAETAVAAGQAEAEDLRLASEILLNVAEHKLSPSEATRNSIFASLQKRTALPDVDMIAYRASEEVMAFDFSNRKWREAIASSALTARLAAQGADILAPQKHRAELNRAVAAFMDRRTLQPHDDLAALILRVIVDVNAAADDAAAKRFEDVYWDIYAWREATRVLLSAEGRFNPSAAINTYSANDRATRMFNLRAEDAACVSKLKMLRNPEYPQMTEYTGIAGAVIVQVDIDEQGMATNPRILGAVPSKIFGPAALRSVPDMRYSPGDKWGSECSLVQKDRTVTFSFWVG